MASLNEQLSDLISNITSLSSKEMIGLDIGVSGVKVAVISQKGKKFTLEKFENIALGEAVIIEDEVQRREEVIEAIVAAIKGAGIRAKSVCLGVSGPNTMTKRMQVPDGTDDEIEDQIIWESEQYIPFGADDSEISHQILGDNEGGGKDVIMVAARSDMIESFMDLVKEAKLNVKIVDLKVLAINNIFEIIYQDHLEELSEAGAIVIDFGAQTTHVLVYKNHGPVLTKEINIGSVLITEEIQRQMGVSFDEAENLKVSGDESGNLPEDIVSIIDYHLESLFDEIRKAVGYYVQSGTEKINQCFVTGGASLTPTLLDKLVEILECEVIQIDPFQKIEVSKALDEHQLSQALHYGVVSMGLSLRGVDGL